MSKVEAMNGYINVLQKLSPNWEESSPWPQAPLLPQGGGRQAPIGTTTWTQH